MSLLSKVLIIVFITLFVVFVTSQIVDDFQDRRIWNAWNQDCTAVHGVVGMVGRTAWGEQYECFVNGKIKTLPGWEAYSTGVRN
jgi:hypothetical protein